ncbi:Sodium-coupled monocarboxylate transporter 2 [Armadillidium vulgare]|nr:Sodium-coupled monocarboxylate transporter 2 [Armadillidium vulgare]
MDNLSMSYEIISIEHTQELLELGNLPEKYPLISFSHDGKQFIIIPSSRFIQFSLPTFSPELADYLQGKATRRRIHYYRKLFVSELSVYLKGSKIFNVDFQKHDEAVKASYKRTGPLKWVISHLADRRRKQVTRKEGKVFVCETTSVDETYNLLQLCYEIGLRLGSNINSLMTAAKTIILKLHRIDTSSIDALIDYLSEGDQRLVSTSEIDPFPGPYATLKDGEMIIYLPEEKKMYI